MSFVAVIGPDGQPERRRAQQRTMPGTTYIGQAVRFPVGGVEPIPRQDEAALAIPEAPGWRMYRFRTARRGA